jgi:UDP-N-acetylmuramoyl-tripeptide--D-alanyl-D-alanine ligase
MKPMTLEEIRCGIRGRWLARGKDATITGVTIDTRSCRSGELFVAIRGERFDGHEFLAQSADAGCVGAMVAQDASFTPQVLAKFPAGVIGVDDTISALGRLGAFHRRHVVATVLAVTGSNGKTTTKRMINHILAKKLKGSASPKSFNNNIGLPLTLLGVGATDDYVVCEIGTNAPGEIRELSEMAQPDIAVITCVGPTHLEKLIDLPGVAAEKASMLWSLSTSRRSMPSIAAC